MPTIGAPRRSILAAILTLAACVFAGFGAGGSWAAGPELTFFGWSDQHVQTGGDGSHLIPAIDAMNALPGTKYPEKIGGAVARPEFVLGCGDITEWPTHAAKTTYDELVSKRLKFPSFDLMGNHDEGGKVPSETIKKWITARHGGPSYTFDRGGVHFVALFSKYDENLDSPAQPIHKDALAFLRNDLAKLKGTVPIFAERKWDCPPPKSGSHSSSDLQRKPVVVAMHLCHDAITNREELVAALGEARVLAVLGGHYHQATVHRYRGVPFVQLPSPWRNGPGQFTVIRITPDRLVAIPYDYRLKKWSDNPRAVLDVPLGKNARQ